MKLKKGIIKRSTFVLFLSVCILATSISTVYASAHDIGSLESDEFLASEITYTDISSPYKESLLVYEDGAPILLTRVVCGNSVSVTATDEFGNILASAITWLDGQTLRHRENDSIHHHPLSLEHDTSCSIRKGSDKTLDTRAHTLIPLDIYETRRYSYAQIKEYIGDNASLVGIAVAVLYFLSKAGFAISGGLSEVLTVVGGIDSILYFIVQGDTEHGITLTLRKYKLISEKYDETGIFYEWRIVSYGKY